MSPEERQLLQGLFDRMRPNANNQRDAEAEQMIADNVRQQPYAPYLLAQTVLVQDQALQAANAKLEELQAQVRGQGQGQSGGFLSGLFGGGGRQEPPPVPAQRPVWNQGGAYPQGGGYPPQGGYPQQGGGYPPPPPQGGPWGGGGGMMGSGGGGFLHGAMQTAAGVAGGVLLADGIRDLFGSHNNPMGMMSGMPGMGGGNETVVNNFYGDPGQNGGDLQNTMDQNAADFDNSGNNGASDADWASPEDAPGLDSSDFGGGSDDNSYDV